MMNATIPSLANLLAELPVAGGDEQFVDILRLPGCRIERIVSHGHSTPIEHPYQQAHDEWVLLLAGAAVLDVEGVETTLRAGDHVLIPAGAVHRVVSTDSDQPTVWLAVHIGEGRDQNATN